MCRPVRAHIECGAHKPARACVREWMHEGPCARARTCVCVYVCVCELACACASVFGCEGVGQKTDTLPHQFGRPVAVVV